MILFLTCVKKIKLKFLEVTKKMFYQDILIVRKYKISTIVRITSDCPLIDHTIIDK